MEIRPPKLTPSAVAAATAEVRINAKRVGSAVLVDSRHLLTARHVVAAAEQAGGPPVSITVTFPAIGKTQLAATVVDLARSTESPDLAVLDLGGGVGVDVPAAAGLWAGQRISGSVKVFGYPRNDPTSAGVWKPFRVAGPAGEMVQIDWESSGGTFEGHSGGPVIDAISSAVVGILLQSSAVGGFDRFLPLRTIERLWSGLHRPWLMAGENARSHALSRAQGRPMRLMGDFFQGRQQALERIASWLAVKQAPQRILVVTGQPGSGKSAVLSRAALEAEQRHATAGLFFHARNADSSAFARALSCATDTADENVEAVVDELELRVDATSLGIFVDALDEVGDRYEQRRIAAALVRLARLPDFRVVVATRPMTSGDRFHTDSLLRQLGVDEAGAHHLVDLDDTAYRDSAAICAAAEALLTQIGATDPGPAGCAWVQYREQQTLTSRLARLIAQRSDNNFLVVSITAAELSVRGTTLDIDGSQFTNDMLPANVGEVVANYLRTLSAGERKVTEELLVTLAYARGPGLTDNLWLELARALGYTATRSDLDSLRAGMGADYLLETTSQTERLTRVFHQALVDQLLVRRDQRADHGAIFLSLTLAVADGGRGWGGASAYALSYTAEHGAKAGLLSRVLDDVDFLAHADMVPLLTALMWAPTSQRSPVARIVMEQGMGTAGAAPRVRLQILGLAAVHLGFSREAEWFLSAAGCHLRPEWAHTLGAPARVIVGHGSRVNSVAIGRFGGRTVIASASDDRTVRLWDELGRAVGVPLTGHAEGVNAVAIGRLGDHQVVVSAGIDGSVRIWHEDETPVRVLRGHVGSVRAVAVGRFDDQDVVVTGGVDKTVRIWAPDGTPIALWEGHQGWVKSIAVGEIGTRTIIASASYDFTVRLWAGDGDVTVCGGPHDWVNSVAIGRHQGRDVIVAGGADQTVRIWDEAGQPLATLQGHSASVNSVAVGRWAGKEAIVSASDDHTIRVWPEYGARGGMQLRGHASWVRGVAAGELGGQDVIVSAGNDRSIRIWEQSTAPEDQPLQGPGSFIRSAAMGNVDGVATIISASSDQVVRLWDARGRPLPTVFKGESEHVRVVTIGRVAGHDRLVTAYRNIRVWDADGCLVGDPLKGRGGVNALAVGPLDGTDVIVSGGEDHVVRIWSSNQVQSLVGHRDVIRSVAIGSVGGRDLVVSAGDDSTVLVWDVNSGPIGLPLRGHERRINAVALGSLDSEDVIVSGSRDGTVRIWAADLKPIRTLTGHGGSVLSIAVGRFEGQDVIASSGADRTVRLWTKHGEISDHRFSLIAPGANLSFHKQALFLSSGTALMLLRTGATHS